MSIKDQDYGCVVTTSNTAWNTTAGTYFYDESSPNIENWRYVNVPSVWIDNNQYKKGDDNMRYLYEVILVNPKDEEFEVGNVVARSEVAALMYAYEDSKFNDTDREYADFDDLKTQCRVLMQWKKEVSNNG